MIQQKKKTILIIGIIAITLLIIIGSAGCTTIIKTNDNTTPTSQHTTPVVDSDSSNTPQSTPTEDQKNKTNSSLFSMHVIDMGQGDSILLEKDGKYALIDCGETMTPSSTEAKEKIFNYLDSKGVKTLEFLLLTHQDYDHIGSALSLIKTYNVKMVYDNGFPHTSKTYLKLMAYILDNDVPYKQIREGDSIESPWKDVKITVLSPPQDLIDTDTNHNSIVLKITYGDVSYLLMGDAETKTEKYILSTGNDISAQILKAGHHGSRTGSSKDFLKVVSPETVVISLGTEDTGNSYNVPHTKFLERILNVIEPSNFYRTDIDGTVVISTDGKTYSVKTENTNRNLTDIFYSGEGEQIYAE